MFEKENVPSLFTLIFKFNGEKKQVIEGGEIVVYKHNFKTS